MRKRQTATQAQPGMHRMLERKQGDFRKKNKNRFNIVLKVPSCLWWCLGRSLFFREQRKSGHLACLTSRPLNPISEGQFRKH